MRRVQQQFQRGQVIMRLIRTKPVKGIARNSVKLDVSNSSEAGLSDLSTSTTSLGSQTNISPGDMPSLTTTSQPWQWVPPSKLTPPRKDNDIIPVIEGQLLSSDEIKDALIRLGGIDVLEIDLQGKLGEINSFILATGTSTRHLNKMSTTIVKALSSRKLKQAIGSTGAEGCKDDDWYAIDCFNTVVHLMLPDTRKALDLESHWNAEKRPSPTFNLKEKSSDDAQIDRFIEMSPIPDYYRPSAISSAIGFDYNVSEMISKENKNRLNTSTISTIPTENMYNTFSHTEYTKNNNNNNRSSNNRNKQGKKGSRENNDMASGQSYNSNNSRDNSRNNNNKSYNDKKNKADISNSKLRTKTMKKINVT